MKKPHSIWWAYLGLFVFTLALGWMISGCMEARAEPWPEHRGDMIGIVTSFPTNVTFSGAVHTPVFANSVTSNAVTISANNGDSQSLALTAATGTTAITLSNFLPGDTLTLTINQKASSPVNVSWSGVKWPGGAAPVISTGASAIDEIQIKCTASNVYNGTFIQNFQ